MQKYEVHIYVDLEDDSEKTLEDYLDQIMDISPGASIGVKSLDDWPGEMNLT